MSQAAQTDLDVLIVGAGLSGVGAAHHLKTRRPKERFAIFEAREALGGTWDLFRYPGIRSDSDMYTLGYAFRPWREAKAIADGPSILRYVEETAREDGILETIRFRHRVVRASWCSRAARWTVEAETPEGPVAVTCRFLLMCSGYYDYAGGHDPAFEDEARFNGRIVHAQHWPEDLDWEGRDVVVIGSGATAVTIVPQMARRARKVVMLQRSPTYVVSRPSEDAFANRLRERLPPRLAYGIIRWRNVLLGLLFFNLARRRPAQTKARLVSMVREALGPQFDVATHFTPRYNPWDQRLCLVPDADLFEAIRSERVEVVTDTIARFTPEGIALASGRALPADVVVKATGLRLKLLGGLEVRVDGEPRRLNESLSYKGMMFSGVPNLASVFGYTNASWTLKADLTCEYVCRLLGHMRRRGLDYAVPERRGEIAEAPWLDFTSGYVQRSMADFPKQGRTKPWKVHQNYLLDLLALRFGRLADGALRFGRAGGGPVPSPAAPARTAPAERPLEPA